MAVLKREQITSPTLPRETVEVPEIGGEVIIQGLTLSGRLSIFSSSQNSLAKLLSMTVVDADGETIWDERQWEAFGSRHFTRALELFKVAKRLSGLDAEVAEKK